MRPPEHGKPRIVMTMVPPGVPKRRTLAQWWKEGGKQKTFNVSKSAALATAGAATSATIMWLSRRNPEMAPWLNSMAENVARHPWLALSAYVGLRGAKAYGDYLLLRNQRRMYNMDPAQTLVQNAVVGRRIPFSQRAFSPRGTASMIASGSLAIDTGKQLIPKPVMGLGALRVNPAELMFTGIGAGLNFGILGYRSWRDAMAQRRLTRQGRTLGS